MLEMLILFQHVFFQHFSKILGKIYFLPPTAHPDGRLARAAAHRVEHRHVERGRGRRRRRKTRISARPQGGAELVAQASSCAGELWCAVDELTPERRAAAAQPGRPPASLGRHGGRRHVGTTGRRRVGRREHERRGGIRVRMCERFRSVARILRKWKTIFSRTRIL
jgi:hypothetical protein